MQNRRDFLRLASMCGLGLVGSLFVPDSYAGEKKKKVKEVREEAKPAEKPYVLESRCYSKDDANTILASAIENARKEAKRQGEKGLIATLADPLDILTKGTPGTVEGVDLIARSLGSKINSNGDIEPYLLNVPLTINTPPGSPPQEEKMVIDGKKYRALVGRGYIEIWKGAFADNPRTIQIVVCEDYKLVDKYNFLKNTSTRLGGPFKVGQTFNVLAMADQVNYGLKLELFEDGVNKGERVQTLNEMGISFKIKPNKTSNLTALVSKNGDYIAKVNIPVGE